MADSGGGGGAAAMLKEQGNEQFKSGNYLKAAALYTQAIKLDPDNPTLYSNRAAAFLQLVKLNKALADAETTIKLKPQWEKGYFRKGCVLEAMEQYEEAISAFQIALQHNPQNTEVSRNIKRLTQLSREKKRALDVENMRSNIDIGKSLESLKTELVSFMFMALCSVMIFVCGCVCGGGDVCLWGWGLITQSLQARILLPFLSCIAFPQNGNSTPYTIALQGSQEVVSSKAAKYGDAEMGQNIFSFVVNVIKSAIKVWHDTGKVDARVNFLLDDKKTDTEKYAPVVNIDKAFESPHTHSSCFTFLRQYSEDSFSYAACMVAPKSIISYPQVWKGQGSRKWKLDQSDGFFVQFESPILRKIWFVPSTIEKGRTLCRSPEPLDISIHEVLPRIFKETA